MHRPIVTRADTHRDEKETAAGRDTAASGRFRWWWQVLESNQRRLSRRFARPLPLAPDSGNLPPPSGGGRAQSKDSGSLPVRFHHEDHQPEQITTSRPPAPSPTGHGLTALTWCRGSTESSFDIVSKLDRQEVDNALNQAAKEIGTRFDFRGVGRVHRVVRRAGRRHPAPTARSAPRPCWTSSRTSWSGAVSRSRPWTPGEPKPSGKEYRMGVGPQGGHLPGRRQEDLQDHPGRGAQGRPGSGPGRRAARLVEEEGRPAGRHRAAEGQGLRLRPAVRRLPGATGSGIRSLTAR